jgi:pectin methylesterase-like acyl-CoA thioesterase
LALDGIKPIIYSSVIIILSKAGNMKKILLLLVLSLVAIGSHAQYNLVVAADGSGNYTTVQAAINAATAGTATAPFRIFIKNGRYVEKDTVHTSKVYLQLIGESVGGVTITFGANASMLIPGSGSTYGTSGSATMTVNADNFTAMNITFENTTGRLGDGPQALAINVGSDRVAFKNCRFISGQDTVYAGSPGKRQYFLHCYIDGNTDFIFGNAVAVFDSCVIWGRDRVDGQSGGVITAANTPAGQTYGYVFLDCEIPTSRITTNYSLGRPWQNSGTPNTNPANNKTVFIRTRMNGSIKPAGWDVWDAGTVTSVITYAEYNSQWYSGTSVDVSARVSWSQQLTAAQAANYTLTNIFNNGTNTWNPYTIPGFSGAFTPEIAVANMRVKRALPNLGVSWNISWPVSGVKYELFRSFDNVNWTNVYTTTSTNDTTVAMYYAAPIVSGQSQYYFFVKASKTGYTSNITDTVSINTALPIVGDFRSSVSSGSWGSSTSWERYDGTSWVQQSGTATTSIPQSANDVLIRAGHTITLSTSLNSAGSITVENTGTLNAAATGSTLRVINGVLNSGTFGGATNNNITLEYPSSNTTMTLTGTGVFNFNRIRPLTNLVGAALVIDANLSLYGSLGAWYNNTSVTPAERVSVTINAGDTVTMGPTAFLHNTNASNTNAGGVYNYHINGVLDLSASTAAMALVAAPAATSSLNINVGKNGLLRFGTKLATANTASTPAILGAVNFNISDSARIDGSLLTPANYNMGAAYWNIAGNGSVSLKADSGATLSFPIRYAGSPSPNTLTVINSGLANIFTVGLRDTVAALQAGDNKHVQRQWNIYRSIPSSDSVTLMLSWTIADQTSAFDKDSAYIGRLNSTTWDSLATTVTGNGTIAAPYIATASGIKTLTSFGVFNKYVPTVVPNAVISPAAARSFALSPNPTTGKLILSYSVSSSDNRVAIFDIRGRQLISKQLTGKTGTASFEVSTFTPGIYFLHVTGNAHTLQTLPFVKQ